MDAHLAVTDAALRLLTIGHGTDSPNVALRHPSRAYADYMATDPFSRAQTRALGEASGAVVVIMCAESLWWRRRRRLITDAATLLSGADVLHLAHDGRPRVHRLTGGVRRDPRGSLVYGVGANLENPPARMGRASPGAPALWSGRGYAEGERWPSAARASSRRWKYTRPP